MVVVNWQEMVGWVDINNFKHFTELKTPHGTSGTQETSTSLCGLLLCLQEVNLTINQSGNAIDLASTVNLRNTLGL